MPIDHNLIFAIGFATGVIFLLTLQYFWRRYKEHTKWLEERRRMLDCLDYRVRDLERKKDGY